MLKVIRYLFGFLLAVCLVLGISLYMLVFFLTSGENAPDKDPLAEVAVYYQPAPTPGSDLQSLEADAEISIPASAREIYGMISGFRELDTWVRLDLPNAELAAFLQNARCTRSLAKTDPEQHHPGQLDPSWWQPHKATSLEECSGLHDYLYQRILVDRSKPDMLTIYVFSITQSYTAITTLTPKP